MVFLALGFLGSLMVTYRLSEEDCEQSPMRVFLPWAAVAVCLLAASIWLLYQPMEMRATLLAA